MLIAPRNPYLWLWLMILMGHWVQVDPVTAGSQPPFELSADSSASVDPLASLDPSAPLDQVDQDYRPHPAGSLNSKDHGQAGSPSPSPASAHPRFHLSTDPGWLAQAPEPTPSPDQHWARIQAEEQIRVGIDPSLGETYLYVDPDTRTYTGFEWDILQAIAAHLNVAVQPIYIPWDQQLESLQQDQVDLILGAREAEGIHSTEFLATQPYYFSPQRLVIVQTQDQDPIEQLSELFGQKVGIVVNSTGAALLETYNQRRGHAIRLFATRHPERLFDQLRSGQLDAIVIDQPVAVAAVAESDPPLMISGPPLFPVPLVGVVLADQPSLKQALDAAILALETDGTLKQILEDWQLWDPTVTPLASNED